MGHGHVTPNPDGSKARCGGLRFCAVCQREQTQVLPADLLTPEERAHIEEIRHWATGTRFLAIIDRLAPPVRS